MSQDRQHRVLIIGAGVAALSCAAALVERGVTDIGIYAMASGGTPYVAAINFVVPDNPHGDTVERYAQDMLEAGYHIADPELLRALCAVSPEGYALLSRWGVRFSEARDGFPLLRRTSGSSLPRSLCSTRELIGEDILRTLTAGLKAKGVRIELGVRALDLLSVDGRICGAALEDAEGRRFRVRANSIVAAWGGVGNLLGASTYPQDVDGAMMAQAFLAGTDMIDMEFLEFEPLIVLYPPEAAGEPCPTAMLGEGAKLLDARNERFFLPYRPQGEAGASKTLLNKAIWQALREGHGTEHGGVYVDLREIPVETLRAYPWFYNRLKNAGCDPAKELVEVAPLAHSFSGGIRVDEGMRATIPGLYAVGEAAGGMHGACRIGGNAAAQAVMSAILCAEAIAKDSVQAMPAPAETALRGDASVRAAWLPSLEKLAMGALGAFRERERMETALTEVAGLLESGVADADSQTRARAVAIALMLRAALAREESRGVHMRADFPKECADYARAITLCRGAGGRPEWDADLR